MSRTNREQSSAERVFNSQNKEMNSAVSVLSKLFRIIAADLNMKFGDYNRMVNQWLDDPVYGINDDPKKRSTVRGNLNKEVVRPEMSFRTFLKAVCACTGTKSLNIRVTLKRKGSKIETDHEINIQNLPELVAQLLHDSPDRSTRVRTRKTMRAEEKVVSFTEEKDIDSIANDMEEIVNVAVDGKYRKGPITHTYIEDTEDGC